jgi:hypothetical protein
MDPVRRIRTKMLRIPNTAERFRIFFSYFSLWLVFCFVASLSLALIVLCRREVLKALGSDLRKELQYCREMIEEHPKGRNATLIFV